MPNTVENCHISCNKLSSHPFYSRSRIIIGVTLKRKGRESCTIMSKSMTCCRYVAHNVTISDTPDMIAVAKLGYWNV